MPEPERPSSPELTQAHPSLTEPLTLAPQPQPQPQPQPAPLTLASNPHPRQVELLLMRALSLQLIRGKNSTLKSASLAAATHRPRDPPISPGLLSGPKGRALSPHGC